MPRTGRNIWFLAAEALVLVVLLLAWGGFSHRGLTAADWGLWLAATAPLALAAMSQTIPVIGGGQGLTAGATKG